MPHQLPHPGKPFPWHLVAHCIPEQEAPVEFELQWDVDHQGNPRCDLLPCVLSHSFAPSDFHFGLSLSCVTEAVEEQVLVVFTWGL